MTEGKNAFMEDILKAYNLISRPQPSRAVTQSLPRAGWQLQHYSTPSWALLGQQLTQMTFNVDLPSMSKLNTDASRLPAVLSAHSAVSHLLALLKSWLASKQQAHDKIQLFVLLLKLHIQLLSEEIQACCGQTCHKFLTALLPQGKKSHCRGHNILQFFLLKTRHLQDCSFSKLKGIFRLNF